MAPGKAAGATFIATRIYTMQLSCRVVGAAKTAHTRPFDGIFDSCRTELARYVPIDARDWCGKVGLRSAKTGRIVQPAT
jgi:hypothetical protein